MRTFDTFFLKKIGIKYNPKLDTKSKQNSKENNSRTVNNFNSKFQISISIPAFITQVKTSLLHSFLSGS